MSPRVSVIILNWNGWQDTVECLESLYRINYPNYQVILVDNHSQDQSLPKIREYCQGNLPVKSPFFTYQKQNKPIKITEINENEINNIKKTNQNTPNIQNQLTLLKNNTNHGFAQGNNIGITFALKKFNPDYLLLLNNDTVVDENFLGEMVKIAEDKKEIGFIGPKTYFYDSKNVIQAAGGGNIDLNKGESHEIGFKQFDNGEYDKYLELDYVGGSCLLIRTDILGEVGLLDPDLFMYWEDVDWCFTGREHGYKSVYAYKSRIWHKYGTSSENYLKTYYHNRNRLYFIKKHAEGRVYRSFLMHYLREVLSECGYQLLYQRNWEMFKALFSGTIAGFRLGWKIKK